MDLSGGTMKKTILATILSISLILNNIIFIQAALTEEKVHFIDVGQGDSTLVESNGLYMLIDAGDEAYGDVVIQYLEENNVEKLDYIIATHPHADHIGGLDDVINKFAVDTVIIPNVPATTKVFERLVMAINKSGATVKEPIVGENYVLGDFSFTIIAPVKYNQKNLNNSSVGVKLVNDNDSFIMVGDAEATAEKDIINSGLDIKANVLKLNHHGSNTSTNENFLNSVSPEHIVISVGANNDYGHPHKETLDKIKDIDTYRTDEYGSIIALSSGNGIEFTSPTDEESEYNWFDYIIEFLSLVREIFA